MKASTKKEVFTIPNLLTLIRLLSCPFFVWQILIGTPQSVLTGLIILVASSSTDLIDGYIARRFNQMSELGKAFDPIADKIMHVSALVSLTIIGYVHVAFVILIALKEFLMVLGGVVLVTKKTIIQANIYGKVASFVLTIGIFLSFFHPFMVKNIFYLDWIVLGLGVATTYVAFVKYATVAFKSYKEVLNRTKDGTK